MRKLDLNKHPIPKGLIEEMNVTAMCVAINVSMGIKLMVDYESKHDMLFLVEESYYRRKKLKDLVELTFTCR